MRSVSLSFVLFSFIVGYMHPLTVHVIGDSHGFFCFNNTQSGITADEVSSFHYSRKELDKRVPFHIHWLGSRTMHRIGRDGLNGLNIRRLGVKEGDVVVFLFGEVDVRCHIGRQRDEKNRPQAEVIETLAQNYLKAISDNKDKYKNLTCFVASITPPCDRGYNVSYPFYGPLSERVAITQELNNFLEKSCKEYDIYFLDIYTMYAQEDGSLGLHMSDGIVHISPKLTAPIKEKLIDQLLNITKF